MDMKITVSHPDQDTCIVALHGEMDVYTAPQFTDWYHGSATRKRLIVNIENLRYIDQTGLGALIKILRRQHEHDGLVAIVCTNPQIRKIFDITGLVKIFPIHTSDQEALDGSVLASS